MDEARADAAVRAIVLTGSGEKSFVAGADINELAVQTPVERPRACAAAARRVFDRIERLGKPVIAAVNGFALGGGCELAMACTLRIAADTAKFGQPEINLGLIPGYAGSQRLPRLVGRGRALELLLTGAQISAEEAHRIGLVNKVVPARTLMTEARALAHDARGEGAGRRPLHSRSRRRRPGDVVRRRAGLRGDAVRPGRRRPTTCAKARARFSKSARPRSRAADAARWPTRADCARRFQLSRLRDHAPRSRRARRCCVNAASPMRTIETFAVPGAYELAQAAHRLAVSGQWHARRVPGLPDSGRDAALRLHRARGGRTASCERRRTPACPWRSAC